MKYTPEPWRVWDHVGDAVIEVLIPGTTDVYGDISTSLSPENARRIVACVNACKGYETETLEILPIGFFEESRIEFNENLRLRTLAENQRDELLRDLRTVLSVYSDRIGDGATGYDIRMIACFKSHVSRIEASR